MPLAFITSLSRLLTRQKTIFFASSALSRLAWAGMIVYLASSLDADEYGEFSFWAITAGSLSAVIFGGFANSFAYEQSRTQQQLGHTTSPIVYAAYAGLYFFVFFGTASAILYTAALEIDLKGGALVGGLATSLVLSNLAISHLCALRFFLVASLSAALGPVLFISLSLCCSDGTSERVIIFSAISNLVSFTPVLLTAIGQSKKGNCYIAQARDILFLHGRSIRVSLANLPVQGSLLALAAVLMANQGAATFAQYGLANQLIGVLLFIPTALAPIFLTQLPQWETSRSIGHILRKWCGLLFLVTLAPIVPIFVAISFRPNWIDEIFLTSAWTGIVATIAAAFIASRSPFAWLNQARNNISAEWSAAFVSCCTILIAVVFIDMGSSEEAMIVRLIAGALSLFASVVIFCAYRWPSEKMPD